MPVKRKNPWSGGRVVDGYAREAFCLLMRSVQTGECMSISKLFYIWNRRERFARRLRVPRDAGAREHERRSEPRDG